ncbi:hypothetical protein SMKI_15G4280 [Saccharomyces mikatae IFO 1815]|uniref:Uncharacterized protein n=1 Tax=Saccharomyces mikatae IFO 1815 TaxID=226126 RepID=A0AA35IVP3_SACMI|nr:uncharacterized protein SMKI_15G4280 [Saccharomyces mikatae IFO 1815]CAI4036580.1 hypothetical protein SMKI_15G4280 [Saccharomyces mikatae IFO 1815]
MTGLNDYSSMIDIVLSDMDLESVTTKKVRRSLKEVYAVDVESQGKDINKLIRKRLECVKERPPSKRSLQDLLRENAILAMDLTKDMTINRRLFEEEERNDNKTNDNYNKRKKGAVSKSPISTQKVALSKSLVHLLGETRLTRTEVVRRIWAYIKEHNLQNPNNKKEILCDDNLGLIFGESTDMFEMHKTLVSHMTDPNKTSDQQPLVQAVHKKEKLGASDSEKPDEKDI